MSRLSALIGKSEKVMIGDLELEIKPLSIEDMELFALDKDASQKEQVAMMKSMVRKVLKEAEPDTTDEEISSISMEHIQTIMNAIMKVNKMENPTAKLDVPKQDKE